MRKLPASKLLGALVAGALFLPNIGFTLGLGEIEVNSALNQKLKADIELLSTTPEDTENIIVKLASRKEFLRAGLDRPYLLNDLRFKTEMIDGVPHIIVTSGSPIREPFLNFLVEVDWPNGHLLREYTILLDPPAFMTQSAGAVSTPAKQSSGRPDTSGFRPGSGGATSALPGVTTMSPVTGSYRPSASQPQSEPVSQAPTSRAFVPAPVVQPQTMINQMAGSYRIKGGDTAWSLAEAMRPDRSISVEQMMIAMLRTNPESFIKDNINGLKRGYILRVPDYDQIASINQADAVAMVREQAALWRSYQQSRAGGQPVSAMETSEPSGSAADQSGDLSANDSAYLEIVSAGSGTSSLSGKDPTEMSAQELRAELALARERVETERVEKEALKGRVTTLEQHVDKMKGMLSIEDEELSEVQSLNLPVEADPDQAAQDILTGDADALTEEAEADAEAMADDSAEAAESDLAEGMTDEMLEETSEGMPEGADEETPFTDETATADSDAESSDDQLAEMPEQIEAATDDIASAQQQIANEAPADSLSQLLNNPMMLAAAGGGLLLIVALIGLIIKRRNAASETDGFAIPAGLDDFDNLSESAADIEEEVTSSLASSDAATDTDDDFDSTSSMDADLAEDRTIEEAVSDAMAENEGPRDDVIAEADVYLAYGIYQQAEELLSQAIADNPEREDYRVKLAETHYASKNADAFLEVAGEIKKRIDSDDSPAWKKVLGMGQDLCAHDPMFQGSMVGGLAMDPLSSEAPSMDFDLGIDEPEDAAATSDSDLAESESPLELPDMDEVEEAESTEPVDELEFDLSDTGAVEALKESDSDFSLDIDASELDIDLPDKGDSEVSIDLGDLDTADEDLDFGLDEADTSISTAAVEEEIALDLTSEVEALDDDLLAMDLSEEAESADALTDEEDFDLSSLDDVDEISTKLDLARAYLDMGDHDGTRGILEEVLADGNDEQKQEASDLMSKLD